MTAQCNQLPTQLLELLTESIKQTNLVVQQNNQLIQQIAVQSNQINELLLILDQEQDDPKSPEYMDD